MARKRNPIPTYREKNGRGIVTVRNPDGSRRDILLPGKYDSDESKQAYGRVLSQLRANGGNAPPRAGDRLGDLSIDEIAVRFLEEHVLGYYVHPVTKQPTSEQRSIKTAIRPLTRLYGSLPAAEFGPVALRAVRESMITGSFLTEDEKDEYLKSGKEIGYCRKTCNKHVGRIRLMFRWASEHEIIRAAIYHGLLAVRGLKAGRSGARETLPVLPVALDVVEKVIPCLPPITGDIVRLLLLTGARVGELCELRTRDIDRGAPIWLAELDHHKTLHHGHTRTLCFGPQAQLILRRYLKADPDAHLFSPAEQDLMIAERKRAARKTKVQPSQRDRRKARPCHKPGAKFGHDCINHAIRRAAERIGVPRFHVHQLRHSAALNVLREHGAEAARSLLGHRTVNMTLHYSGIDLERAKEVASKLG